MQMKLMDHSEEDLDVQSKQSDGEHVVTVYKQNEILLKIEPGTSLKILKLLCESEGVTKQQILGVKPNREGNGISCILTLDETKLFEKSYQLVLSEAAQCENEECKNCQILKYKQFTSTATNTDREETDHFDENNNWKHKVENRIKHLPLDGDYSNKPSFYPKTYSNASDIIQFVPSPTRNEINESYRTLQEATKRLYARQPGIESVQFNGFQPISSSTPSVGTVLYNESKHSSGRFNQIMSKSASVNKLDEKKLNLAFSDAAITKRLKRESPFDYEDLRKDRCQTERNGLVKKSKYKEFIEAANSFNEKYSKIKAAADIPPALLHVQEKVSHTSEQQRAKDGEEPPVFVLPNDFDILNGDEMSKLQKRDSLVLCADYPTGYSPTRYSPSSNEQRKVQNVSPRYQNKTDYAEDNNNNSEKADSNKSPRSPDSSTNVEAKLHCKICDSSFATKSLLYKHLRGHTSDEKPFKCSECGQGFTLSSNLRQHRIIHRGYKPFQCEFCGKKFMRSNVYKQHRRIHTGEEMHKCTLCPSEFLQKYALIKHMKKNHNIDAADI